jgi:hypothetical protein
MICTFDSNTLSISTSISSIPLTLRNNRRRVHEHLVVLEEVVVANAEVVDIQAVLVKFTVLQLLSEVVLEDHAFATSDDGALLQLVGAVGWGEICFAVIVNYLQ